MHAYFPEAYRGDNGIRMLYRSSHLYLLHVGFLNLILGTYLTEAKGRKGKLRTAGSLLVLAGTFLLVAAFFTEPSSGVIHRPITFPAMLCLLLGVLAHVFSHEMKGAKK